MDSIDRAAVCELVNAHPEKGVSIYLSAHGSGNWGYTRQDATRLRQALRRAHELLVAGGARSAEADAILEPANLLNKETFFRESPTDGLAMFLSRHLFRYYRVPVHFEDDVSVGSRFAVRQLLSAFAGQGRLYLLCISKGASRLFEVTQSDIRELHPPQMPRDLQDTLRFEVYERTLVRYRTNARGRSPAAASVVEEGHGIGPGDTKDTKEAAARYFREVDNAVHAYLGQSKSPLLLASVDYLLPLYRSVNTYPALLPDVIAGNPDLMPPKDLQRRAWEIGGQHAVAGEDHARERFRRLAAVTPAQTSQRLEDIAFAALDGRIDTLFLARDYTRWGAIDRQGRRININETHRTGDEDIVDFTAANTVLHAGEVYILGKDELLNGSPVAAILRYPS